MYGNGRPLGLRKRMQVVVGVVILAWATQTLLHRWGFGAEIQQGTGETEKFVPGTGRFDAGATLEIRGDATIVGPEVKLKQICRWSDADAPVFQAVADLVVARIDHGSPFRAITLDQIRTTLHDAGMNMAVVKISGPVTCTVSRSDANYDEQTALRQWAEAKEGKEEDAGTRGRGDAGKEAAGNGTVPISEIRKGGATLNQGSAKNVTVPISAPAISELGPKSLRDLLTEDLSTRVGIPRDQLQVTFNPADEKLLNLSEPLFKFNIEPRQVRDLGEVSWNVLVFTGAGSQKGTIVARARAWRNEVVLAKPLSGQQVIQSDDVSERRVLADRLPNETLLNPSQIVGQ
ncbi:MAG TPA: hypothetical protein VLJ39_13890, partial [Tepidisphaeraceae bacterium]|nr:hypothetical protein [Tepidisphaeraceae bacterium]